jgi:hypothetical protein
MFVAFCVVYSSNFVMLARFSSIPPSEAPAGERQAHLCRRYCLASPRCWPASSTCPAEFVCLHFGGTQWILHASYARTVRTHPHPPRGFNAIASRPSIPHPHRTDIRSPWPVRIPTSGGQSTETKARPNFQVQFGWTRSRFVVPQMAADGLPVQVRPSPVLPLDCTNDSGRYRKIPPVGDGDWTFGNRSLGCCFILTGFAVLPSFSY